jgi:hypothetical protein
MFVSAMNKSDDITDSLYGNWSSYSINCLTTTGIIYNISIRRIVFIVYTKFIMIIVSELHCIKKSPISKTEHSHVAKFINMPELFLMGRHNIVLITSSLQNLVVKSEQTRQFDRPWQGWKDNIKLDFNKVRCKIVNFIQLTQDREHWRIW